MVISNHRLCPELVWPDGEVGEFSRGEAACQMIIRKKVDGGGVGSGFGCCLAKPVGCIWRHCWCCCHHWLLGAAGSSARHQLATASACPYVPTQGWPDQSAPIRDNTCM